MPSYIGSAIAHEARIKKRAERYGFSHAFGLVSQEQATAALRSIEGVTGFARLIAMALATNRIAFDRARYELELEDSGADR